ncbi:MAG: sugar transferase [Acidimicrobiia bacterium]|nr:sugar transferase [Acidimicrobiia bacterium]
MYSRHHRKVKLLLAMADVLLAALAFEAAYQSRVWLPLHNVFFLTVPTKGLLLGVTALLWPVLGYWLGVYDRLDSAHPRIVLRDSFKQTFFGAIGIALVDYAFKLDLSRFFLGLFALFSFLLLCLFRLNAATVVGWIRKEFGAPHYVLVVGMGERAGRLGQALERSAAYGIRLVGFLAPQDEIRDSHIRLDQQTYPVYPLPQLPSLLERDVIDEVVFAVDSRRLAEMEDVLLLCDEDGVRTRVSVDFFPHVNSDVYLDKLEHLPLLTFAAAPHDEILLFLKRVTDMLLASTALVVLSPVMLVLASLIRISSSGPVIFRQVRCGLNGRRFVFYKFRSMVANAEQLKESVRHLNSRDVVFKIPDDPRLTPIGRYLRRFSVDEWPQLWNVIRGDMSLVGPRPAVPEEVEQYKRWQRRRLRMRPGLTCLWALDGRDALDFDTWMRKDMEYIDNWSLGLDWKIMLRTIPRVLSGRGAH